MQNVEIEDIHPQDELIDGAGRIDTTTAATPELPRPELARPEHGFWWLIGTQLQRWWQHWWCLLWLTVAYR